MKIIIGIFSVIAVFFGAYSISKFSVNKVYFPDEPFDSNIEVSGMLKEWFGNQLNVMDEKPLMENSNKVIEQYRFTWLRSSGRPVVMRIVRMKNGETYFIVKVANKSVDIDHTKVVQHGKWEIENQQFEEFKSVFLSTDFGRLPVFIDSSGLDGSRWLIEANISGNYNICVRWTPREGPIYDIGKKFIEITLDDFKSIY